MNQENTQTVDGTGVAASFQHFSKATKIPAATGLTTSFRPGLHAFIPNSLTGPLSGVSVHSSRYTTTMDMAVAALQPDGLPLALFPLYKIVHGFILKTGHYNIASFTTKFFIVSGAVIGVKIIWDVFKPLFIDNLTSSITVPTGHRLAPRLKEWLAAHTEGSAKRHLKLTSLSDQWDDPEETKGLQKQTAITSGWFWYERQPIYFETRKGPTVDSTTKGIQQLIESIGGPRQSSGESGDSICLKTYGFSADVISRFLEMVESDTDSLANTTQVAILYPCYNPEREVDERGPLFSFSRHPKRPLSTIDLDETIKMDLVKDIEEFLEPTRAKWYAHRGIPYRRGYLFHGNPGTGKTSTSTALAGHFKGNLYIASLSQIHDDTHLTQIFGEPRKGDVILLEDIDSAGVNRENMSAGGKKRSKSKKKGVPLSGLLNAIDSISGMNGVILIMTSNNPESLDEALIRPGRIDKQVHMGPVSQEVAKSIFIRMYQEEEVPSSSLPSILPGSKAASDSYVRGLAETFASNIPECQLTPAEVQGFLLTQSTPEQALAEVFHWVGKTMASKSAGRKIVGSESYDVSENMGKPTVDKDAACKRRDSEADDEVHSANGDESDSEESGSGSDYNDEE